MTRLPTARQTMGLRPVAEPVAAENAKCQQPDPTREDGICGAVLGPEAFSFDHVGRMIEVCPRCGHARRWQGPRMPVREPERDPFAPPAEQTCAWESCTATFVARGPRRFCDQHQREERRTKNRGPKRPTAVPLAARTHGRVATYNHGCRCEACTIAKRVSCANAARRFAAKQAAKRGVA